MKKLIISNFFRLFLLVSLMGASSLAWSSAPQQQKTKEEYDKKIEQLKKQIQEINKKTKSDEEPVEEDKKQLTELRNQLMKAIQEKQKLNSSKFLNSSNESNETTEEQKENTCSICQQSMKSGEGYVLHVHKHPKQSRRIDENLEDVKNRVGSYLMEDDIDEYGNLTTVEVPHIFHEQCLFDWFVQAPSSEYKCIICRDSVLDEVKKLFEKHLSSDGFVITVPFFLALCRKGFVELVTICLEKDPSLANCYEPEAEITPLHEAAAGGHVGLVTVLLNKGARKTIYDSSGMRPYDLACLGNYEEVKSLLKPTYLEQLNHSLLYARINHTLLRAVNSVEGLVAIGGLETIVYFYEALFFRPKSWRILQETFFGSKLKTLCTTALLIGAGAYVGAQTKYGGYLLHRVAPSQFKNPYERFIMWGGKPYTQREFLNTLFDGNQTMTNQVLAGAALGA